MATSDRRAAAEDIQTRRFLSNRDGLERRGPRHPWPRRLVGQRQQLAEITHDLWVRWCDGVGLSAGSVAAVVVCREALATVAEPTTRLLDVITYWAALADEDELAVDAAERKVEMAKETVEADPPNHPGLIGGSGVTGSAREVN